eukprot:1142945-Pelagomonas_calceolata.AAC.2
MFMSSHGRGHARVLKYGWKEIDVEKGSNGVIRQKSQHGQMRHAELKRHLEQPSQLKKVKKQYDIIIAEDVELQPCVLRCKGCSKLVSPTQPMCQPSSIT